MKALETKYYSTKFEALSAEKNRWEVRKAKVAAQFIEGNESFNAFLMDQIEAINAKISEVVEKLNSLPTNKLGRAYTK